MRLTLQLNAIDNMSKVVSSAASRSMRSLNNMAQTAQARANRARSQMFESGVMAAGGVAALAYPLKMAANYEMLRIRMVALTQSQSEGMKLYKQTIKLASETPLTLDQVAQATTRLIGFGRTAKDAIVDVKMLGDVVTLAGGDINAAMIAYGQAAGEGRVMTRDLTQFVNAGVPIFKMLGEVTGANGAELKKMAEQGQLSFDILHKAFTVSTQQGGQFANGMQKMSQSASGGWVRMTDEFARFADVFGSSVLPMLKSWNEAMIPMIAGTAQWFRNHQLLAKAVMIVIGAFTAFATVGLVVNGIVWVGSTVLARYAVILGWTGWQAIFASNAMWTLRIIMWGVGMAAASAWKGLLALIPALSSIAVAGWAAVAPFLPFIALGALIAAVVVALTAYIAIAVVEWKEFGAAMLLLMGPIGSVINAFMSIRNHWESITSSFKNGGFFEGIKRIGVVLMDSMLYPIQQLMGLIAKVTGFDWAKSAHDSVLKFRVSHDLANSQKTASVVRDSVNQSQSSNKEVPVIGPMASAQMSGGRNGTNNSINYNPTINIGAGAEGSKEEFASILERHKVEMARMVQDVTQQNNRKQFNVA